MDLCHRFFRRRGLTPSPGMDTMQKTEKQKSTAGRTALATAAVVLLAITLTGLPYYLLPVERQMRSPLRAWFKPSGYIGQSAGLVAFAFFLFLWLYPLRKKVKWLKFTGALGRWLNVHIFAGLTVPWLGAIHAGWRFEGLIGLGYGAMLLVSISGIIGKYLYTRIPRSRSGLELTRGEVENQRHQLLGELSALTGLEPADIEEELGSALSPPGDSGVGRALISFLTNDLARWRAVNRLRRRWRTAGKTNHRQLRRIGRETSRLARRQVALDQQMRMLGVTQRIFGYWHVAHRPIAITALVAVLAHVGVAVSLGVTWLR